MITIKTEQEIETLRAGGKLLARILARLQEAARPGVSTQGLDDLAERLIGEAGGAPSFKGYNPYGAKRPYPASLCASINDEVVHGIPSPDRVLEEGDIIGLDIGMLWPAEAKAKAAGGLRGMYTDTAVTVGVGAISKSSEKLIRVTREALEQGIAVVRVGATTGDIGAAIQEHIEAAGYGVIRDLAGHGVGYKVHEDPFVPNFGERGKGERLSEGMVIAIEPMAAIGTWRVTLDDDEWTFRTEDGKRAAHFEHTVVVGRSGGEVITR
jgi:methionyl aminopeptidase